MTMKFMQRGDVVRLTVSMMRAEFGLALCDDDGEALEIDGRARKTSQPVFWTVGMEEIPAG